MSKRQIWLTDEECDLARRVMDYAKANIDGELNSIASSATEKFALSWSRVSVVRLAAKFAVTTKAQPGNRPDTQKGE